mmetsp:Transcript_16612/g.27726  ORF Transcript_16612/g.27726 Transcript_16612/m.27726 type:complete len:233 (+) Transcript_16612:339-1037(+)
MCTVPEDEPTASTEERCEKHRDVICADRVPRRKEQRCSPDGTAKRRSTVPVTEAVTSIVPSLLNCMAMRVFLCASIWLSRRSDTQSYSTTEPAPAAPDGNTRYDDDSPDSAMSPEGLGVVERICRHFMVASSYTWICNSRQITRRSRFSFTFSTEDGNVISQIVSLFLLFHSLNLRGLDPGWSPEPTKAMRLVQCSISMWPTPSPPLCLYRSSTGSKLNIEKPSRDAIDTHV